MKLQIQESLKRKTRGERIKFQEAGMSRSWVRGAVSLALMAVALLANGCATRPMDRVAIKTHATSTPDIEVKPPRVYEGKNGIVLSGYLRTRAIGAEAGNPCHLHAQTFDAQGHLRQDIKVPAPYLPHNRCRMNDIIPYAIRIKDLPPVGGCYRIQLHPAPLSSCEALSGVTALR